MTQEHIPGLKKVSDITNKITNYLSKDLVDDASTMKLDQIRYLFSVSSELDFSIVSLEKEAELNLQFKRIHEDKGISMAKNLKVAEHASASLKQIDYRHRASFSFKIPFIKRVRVRPSYEYRYRVQD